MVSPSKKRKDRKGRENYDKQNNLGLPSGSKSRQAGSKRSTKSFKPLLLKKFYLDIKNNAVLLKLETKLKTLGAVIEQFLVKEVNYVVTDRKDGPTASSSASCSTLVPSQSPSPSPSPSPSLGVSSPLDGVSQKKSRSRAEAMLERVRLEPQSVKVDPLDNARLWNIPIYSVQEILTRLEKICAKAGTSSKQRPGLKVLRGNYIKLETGLRPEFKQLREWPSINLRGSREESPFLPPNNGSQRLTRKASKDGTERLAGGYCEMCCIDYPDLKAHIVTPRHLQLANCSAYYAQLDILINAKTLDTFLESQMCASVARRCLRSGSVEGHPVVMGSRHSSLTQPQTNGLLSRTRATTRSLDDSCTKQPLEVHCNGIVSNHNHLTRLAVKSDSVLMKESSLEYEGLSRRTRTISASCPGTNNEFSQLSPTGSDITHHLRSRKQLWLPTSLLGTTAEDAVTNSKLKLSRDYPLSEAMKSPAQAKGSLKSPTTPVGEDVDKKIKVKEEEEKISSKLPHSEYNNISKGGFCDDDDDTESEKYCPRVREKFDEKKSNARKKLKKRNIPREVANLSYSDDRRRKVLKKRLSVEEKLIEDNKSYYKVEVLNSKLRSTGYYISQSQRELEMSRANGNDSCVTQNCSEPSKNEVKSEGKEPVVVRFKKVRQTQLSRLSDEAESFMFGEPTRRESSVSTESSEDDDEVSLKLESEGRGRIVTRIKREVLDDSSIGSSSLASSSTSSRRKRKCTNYSISRNNIDYAKFEGPSSRLRFQGSQLLKDGIKLEPQYDLRSERNSLKSSLNENDFENESFDDDKPVIQSKHSYNDLEFAFERAPSHESWYQTFKRQDDCNEFYYPSYTNYPTVLLPYEYPFSVIKKIKTAAMSAKSKRKRFKMNKRVKKLIDDDRPRKSPRCHASTLAIMSSLGKRRLRDSPEKRTDLPSSELSIVSSELIIDEESRCSTIIDPPSVAPSDSGPSCRMTANTITQLKADRKSYLAAETEKAEEEVKKAEENIDNLFSEICLENNDDILAHFVQCIKKELEPSPGKDNVKKGKGKGKLIVKQEHLANVEDSIVCLPVDPEAVEEKLIEKSFTPGPIVDVLSLIDGYRSCNSMERADYEHLNPHAEDALRALIADSCNSSDCGGSSACDYSFLEDGRVCKKRKKKKRNMTGWPASKKKFLRKGEELSTVVLRRNCRVRDGLSVDTAKEALVQPPSEVIVKLKEEPNTIEKSDNGVGGEVKTDASKSDVKPCSTISRTASLDSSSVKSLDQVQACYIRVNKMTDDCLETLSRRLRSSDSSPHSPSKRGSSRQAKVVGRESLRRCR